MEYCKDGLKLIEEASHENIMEYNVSNNNYYLIYFIIIIETFS
jgi:hypothetical protein